jgi:Ca2+-binding RTX toxin-like protein
MRAVGGGMLGLTLLLMLAPGNGHAQVGDGPPDNAVIVDKNVLRASGDSVARSQVIDIATNAAKDHFMLRNDHGWAFADTGAGCVMDAVDTIRCPTAGIHDIVMDGRGGADRIEAVLALSALKGLSAAGGDGNDTVVMHLPGLSLFAKGGAGRDRLKSGPEDSVLLGGRGRDKLKGDGGSDGMSGGRGRDTCKGGGSRDFVKACENVTGVP